MGEQRVDGFRVETGYRLIGYGGDHENNPAFSKEAALAYIADNPDLVGATLSLLVSARFVELEDGTIHDNGRKHFL